MRAIFITLSLAALAGGTLGVSEPLAQSAAHAPGVSPTHAADLSGIWQIESGGSALRRTPPYKPDWAERFRVIRDRAKQGMRIFDGTSQCFPPGMPRFLLFLYPVEFLQTPGQLTLLAEYFNETRRIFTDGRQHPPADELEQTFRGHSVGRWDGSTLVIDTVGIRPDTLFSSDGAPHSAALRVTERIRMTDPNRLEWAVELADPVAFTEPFNFVLTMKRAPPGDEIREYVCEENNKPDVYAPDQPPSKFPDQPH